MIKLLDMSNYGNNGVDFKKDYQKTKRKMNE